MARTTRLAAAFLREVEARFFWLLLITGAFLLFADLGDVYLWQDEAETALIARHWLVYGLPLSTDGVTWVQQQPQPFIEFTSDYIWISHSWLQFALTAVAFAFLGFTTVAARLPLRWLQDKRVACTAAVLLLFCVPFILLVRQCRYYVLSALFTLLILDSYLWLRSDRPWAVPYFILSAVLLYHSHYLAFFPTIAALFLHQLLSGWMRAAWSRFLVTFVLVALLIVPWAYFMRLGDRSGLLPPTGQTSRSNLFHWGRLVRQLGQYFLQITLWIFPLALVVVYVIVRLWQSGEGRWALRPAQTAFCQLCGIVVAVNLLALSAMGWVFFRYLAHLIPLLVAVLADTRLRVDSSAHNK